MNNHKPYLILTPLLLTCIVIKYHISSEANSFQQPSLIMLLFITAIFSHVLITSIGDMTHQTTMLTFHVSGVVACEILLKILLVDFFWYSTINLILLLLSSLFFFFTYLTQLPPGTSSNVDSVPNTEPSTQDIQLSIVGGAYPPIYHTHLLSGTSSNVDSMSITEPLAQDTQVEPQAQDTQV